MAWSIQHRPAMVLLDVNMPVMAGDGMMARRAAIALAVAVVAMSSENNNGLVRFFREPGAVGSVLEHVPRERATEDGRGARQSPRRGREVLTGGWERSRASAAWPPEPQRNVT